MSHHRSIRNRRAVWNAYEAFYRGDLRALASAFAPDGNVVCLPYRSPLRWERTFSGPAKVQDFLRLVADHVRVHVFDAHTWATAGDDVAVRARVEGVLRRDGTPFSEEEVHWWSLDDKGRVKRLGYWGDALPNAVSGGVPLGALVPPPFAALEAAAT